jgi:hypothetical protein
VGVDRKGPLAAFVVIAVIAGVLLVTSVRSQAAPGWLNPANLPASVVAGPAATDPDVWGSVTARVDQVVEQGVVLVQKVTSDPSEVQDPTVTLAEPARASDAGGPARTAVVKTTHHVAHVRHHSADHAHSPAPATHASGSHPGRSHGHGQTAWHAVGHTVGHSAGHGQGHGRGHSHSHGHPGHGRHLGWARHS